MITCNDIPNCIDYFCCIYCPAQVWMWNRIGRIKNKEVRIMEKWTQEMAGLEIKDSGERRQFETGAVRDIQEGKGRYDLLPWEAIHELALHCEQGAIKYGERNCEKGIPIHSFLDSASRHISCYLRGMKDEPHLRAAMWNIAFAIQTELKRPEMQDIPVRKLIEFQRQHMENY